MKDLPEPDNHTAVMIGSLLDNNPWDLEVWVRDDGSARDSHARWFQAGKGEDDPNFRRVSWDWLMKSDFAGMDKVTVLGSAAP